MACIINVSSHISKRLKEHTTFDHIVNTPNARTTHTTATSF